MAYDVQPQDLITIVPVSAAGEPSATTVQATAGKLAGTLAFAEITVNGNTASLTMTTASAYYQWTAGWTQDQAPVNAVTSLATGSVLVNIAGTFVTLCMVNWSCNNTDGIRFGIFKNNSPIPDHIVATDVLTANKAVSSTIVGIDGAVVGDRYDLRVEDTTQGGSQVTVYNANFSIFALTGAS
jgi:hypothetical protein